MIFLSNQKRLLQKPISLNIVHLPCEFCREKRATDWHHMFPNTKWARKKYGVIIDYLFNRRPACNNCNGSHANIELWSESKFLEEAEKLGAI